MPPPRPHPELGSVAVEFALVAVVFVTALLAIVGFGHWLHTLEAVADATRAGARVAVVCDPGAATVRQAIQIRVPQLSLSTAHILVDYLPSGCSRSNCQSVRVSLSGAAYNPWFLAPGAIPVPAFTTSLPRESLQSVNDEGEANPVCN